MPEILHTAFGDYLNRTFMLRTLTLYVQTIAWLQFCIKLSRKIFLNISTDIRGDDIVYSCEEGGTVMPFGYDVSFVIHYNDTYECNSGGIITIKEVKISEDGILIINVAINTDRPMIMRFSRALWNMRIRWIL